MATISTRHLNAWTRFNEEVNKYREEYNDEFAWVYEDVNTSRKVRDFKMSKTGILTWVELEDKIVNGYWKGVPTKNREKMIDEDDAREWLKFWKACLRRARRYNAIDPEVFDQMQEGEVADPEEDEE